MTFLGASHPSFLGGAVSYEEEFNFSYWVAGAAAPGTIFRIALQPNFAVQPNAALQRNPALQPNAALQRKGCIWAPERSSPAQGSSQNQCASLADSLKSEQLNAALRMRLSSKMQLSRQMDPPLFYLGDEPLDSLGQSALEYSRYTCMYSRANMYIKRATLGMSFIAALALNIPGALLNLQIHLYAKTQICM